MTRKAYLTAGKPGHRAW